MLCLEYEMPLLHSCFVFWSLAGGAFLVEYLGEQPWLAEVGALRVIGGPRFLLLSYSRFTQIQGTSAICTHYHPFLVVMD